MSRTSEKDSEISDNVNNVNKNVPKGIFVG